MGKKIFVSYKYWDTSVARLNSRYPSKVRDYVDALETYLGDSDHIYKGEADGDDLSDLSDVQIWEKLKDRIYDSTVTIVMISPNMKETHKADRNQWIPWEVYYSLRETTRGGRTSLTNAVLAVILPDTNGSSDYFIRYNQCNNNCTCHTLFTNTLFAILKNNMFNKISIDEHQEDCVNSTPVYTGEVSYIKCVRWEDFVINPNYYIDAALDIQVRMTNYKIDKTI